MTTPPFPIDVVYCYCSPLSNKFKEQYKPQKGELQIMNNLTDDLKYSMRSVCKNMPWLRNIYVVIDDIDELPSGLDAIIVSTQGDSSSNNQQKQINIVKHSEIIPQEYLPTFNSNVIESYIHKIPTLSEQFVYLNDDMYICKKTSWKHFFTSQGKTITRHCAGPLTHNIKKTSPIMYVQMMQNAIKTHRMSYTRFQHQAFPYRKSIMAIYESKFQQAIKTTGQHKYRHPQDFNLLRFSGCFASTDKLAGKIKHTLENYDMFIEADEEAKIEQLMTGKIQRPQFLCINNTGPDHKHVYQLLDTFF